tara:strand:+ start:360 stop:602 length:243 start_codon:yes stop_codon:yes gene_type:complete
MELTFLTALFFPDYGPNGAPWDLLLLHLFFFAIVIPFHVIIFAARNGQTNKPNGVKDWLKYETSAVKTQETPFPNKFPSV